MPDIAEDLDRYLLKQRIIDQQERRKGVISPSSLGQCYRRQYWTRKGEPESNPIDVATLRVFKIGDIVHELIQSLYPAETREVEAKIDNDVYGHADLVFEDEVKDLKSCGQFQFNKFKKMVADQFAEEKPDYVLQVMCYAKALNKENGSIVLINKETGEIIEFRFSLKTFCGRVEQEIMNLREVWLRSELPSAQPRLYKGKECAYCAFRTKCEITEGIKIF